MARGRFVRKRPAEINLDIRDLTTPYRQDLCVAKPTPIRSPCVVGDEDLVPIRDQTDEIERVNELAVGPASRKIRRPIDVVIERARKVEVFRDQCVDGGAVLSDIGLVACSSNGN